MKPFILIPAFFLSLTSVAQTRTAHPEKQTNTPVVKSNLHTTKKHQPTEELKLQSSESLDKKELKTTPINNNVKKGTTQLQLTPDQIKKIKQAMKKHEK